MSRQYVISGPLGPVYINDSRSAAIGVGGITLDFSSSVLSAVLSAAGAGDFSGSGTTVIGAALAASGAGDFSGSGALLKNTQLFTVGQGVAVLAGERTIAPIPAARVMDAGFETRSVAATQADRTAIIEACSDRVVVATQTDRIAIIEAYSGRVVVITGDDQSNSLARVA